MNRNYFVIHSENPYLLARFCTELQMEGYQNRHYVQGGHLDLFNPFEEPLIKKIVCSYLHVEMGSFSFQSHDYCWETPPQNRLALTSRNYREVLQTVLAEKGGEG